MKINKIKGTTDFYNKKYIILKFIIKKIEQILILNGYIPIKTPSLENKKILDSLKINLKNKIIYKIKKNIFLIYDLTIPLIRFLINNHTRITYPFKKYQIQKVWRGEKPQLNRYREFYQFDVDIISLKNYNNNAFLELTNIADDIFKELKIGGILKINNINILHDISILLNIKNNKFPDFLTIVDKINKIGILNTFNLLILNNVVKKKVYKKFLLLYKINRLKKNSKKLRYLKKILNKKKINTINIENHYILYKELTTYCLKKIKISIDFFLSRGINYYNDIVFEVVSLNYNTSLLGGGKYDNLIKIRNRTLYCIGMSFGINRIFNDFTKKNSIKTKKTKILFINLKLKYRVYYKYSLIFKKHNIITEIFPYYINIKKQIKYAEKKKIKYIIFIGKKEISTNTIKIKNIKRGEELLFNNAEEVINFISSYK